MTRLLLLIITLLSFSAAQAAEGVIPVAYIGAYNRYVLGNGVVAAPRGVVQGGVTMTSPNGGYVDFWGSTPLYRGPLNDYGRETDLTVGWRGDVGGASAHFGVARFNLTPTRELDRNDVTQVFAELAPADGIPVRIGTLSPFVRFELMNSGGRGLNDKVFSYVGVRHAVQVGGGVSLSHRVQASNRPDIPGVPGGMVLSYRADLAVLLGQNVSVGPMLERIIPQMPGRDPQTVLGLTGSYKF